MRFTHLLLSLSLGLFCLQSYSASHPNLVLLPIDVSEQDADLEAEYGAALQEGLQNRYTVFYGALVEKELEKEYKKIDCDAEMCNQNVAIAFNGELIGDAAVKRIKGGYLLKLVVRNVLTSEVIEIKADPCRGCDSFDVIDHLKALGRGEERRSVNAPNIKSGNAVKAKPAGKAILVFDSQPSGASIIINGKAAGKTPYQGLKHHIGENLIVELKHSIYKAKIFDIVLEQGITQLPATVLEIGQGQVHITIKPFKADALIYVDGQVKGIAPLNLTLTGGRHQIKANHKGRESKDYTLRLNDSDHQKVTLSFVPLNNKFGMTFSQIPTGSFSMGSYDNEGSANEKPNHTVNIPAFNMMTTEVTQGQWKAIMGNNPSKFMGGVFSDNDNYPVENVSWNDVQDFIKKINLKTRKTHRLPNEAEWEYAARANSITQYSWGDAIDCTKARYGYHTNECGKRKSAAPVKSFSPNAFGLYDMQGNVWEWTQDCWNTSYKGAPTDGSAWQKGNCDRAVVRGGSWLGKPDHLRSANRTRFGRAIRNDEIGFRLILER